MSLKTETIKTQMAAYVRAMRAAGKEVTQIHVTPEQMLELKTDKELIKAKDYQATGQLKYKNIPIMVYDADEVKIE